MNLKNRLARLEDAILPQKHETIWTWEDPDTGEVRHDEPPEDIRESTEWIHIIVRPLKEFSK